MIDMIKADFGSLKLSQNQGSYDVTVTVNESNTVVLEEAQVSENRVKEIYGMCGFDPKMMTVGKRPVTYLCPWQMKKFGVVQDRPHHWVFNGTSVCNPSWETLQELGHFDVTMKRLETAYNLMQSGQEYDEMMEKVKFNCEMYLTDPIMAELGREIYQDYWTGEDYESIRMLLEIDPHIELESEPSEQTVIDLMWAVYHSYDDEQTLLFFVENLSRFY